MRTGSIVYDPDFDRAMEMACAQALEQYLGGFQHGAAGVTPKGIDVDFVRQFFADRIKEFDNGRVSRYSYPIWQTIGHVLSFDMDIPFAFLDVEPGEKPDPKRDICSSSLSLPASDHQVAIAGALKRYLIAAAALARRIGSTTYEGWRALLVQVEFEGRPGFVVFDGEGAFDRYYARLNELLRILWADNEISQHNSVAQPPPTHPRTRAKNAG